MKLTNFTLTGLTCGACAKLATRALDKIDGVSNVEVMENGNAKLTAERVVEKKEVSAALAGTDYKVI